jgi:hypothetical protein
MTPQELMEAVEKHKNIFVWAQFGTTREGRTVGRFMQLHKTAARETLSAMMAENGTFAHMDTVKAIVHGDSVFIG